MGNGTTDADEAQEHGADRVSVAQTVQVVGHHRTSVLSGGISGAETQLGTAEVMGESPFGSESKAALSNGILCSSNWQERSHTGWIRSK